MDVGIFFVTLILKLKTYEWMFYLFFSSNQISILKLTSLCLKTLDCFACKSFAAQLK